MSVAEYRVGAVRDSALGRARLLLLGLWSGAMLAFGGLFVPAAFSQLPTQLAAGVLGQGFAGLDRAGMAIGLLCVALRESAGGAIGQLGAGDPGLAQFGALHSTSRALFGIAAASALLAALWDLWERAAEGPPGASPDAGNP